MLKFEVKNLITKGIEIDAFDNGKWIDGYNSYDGFTFENIGKAIDKYLKSHPDTDITNIVIETK